MDVDAVLRMAIFLTILLQIQKGNLSLFIMNFIDIFLTFELLHRFFETYFVIDL